MGFRDGPAGFTPGRPVGLPAGVVLAAEGEAEATSDAEGAAGSIPTIAGADGATDADATALATAEGAADAGEVAAAVSS